MKGWAADNQRVRDTAALLPFAAAVLILPPFILLFAVPVTIAGIPLIVLYIFGVWALIIATAFAVARSHEPLSRAPAAARESGQPDATFPVATPPGSSSGPPTGSPPGQH